MAHRAGVGNFVDSTAGGHYLPAVEYRVLGPLAVVTDGVAASLGGPKQRVVISVLVAAAGRPVGVDTLLQALYGEDAAPRSRASLQTYVSNLRNLLGDVIVRQGDAYVLDVSAATVDAVVFEDAYRRATALPASDEAAAALRQALAMWRGHPYADVEAHGVLDGEMTRLGELRLAAIEARIDADVAAGRHREVVAELDALTVEYPFREHLRAMQMVALYRSGRQAEALRAFGRTRDTLVEDLGVDPSPELRELERRILVHDRDLLGTVGPQVQRRAVLVADIDDVGWSGPAERELAFAQRESLLASAAGSDGGLKLAPRGTAGYVVFAEPIHAVRAARALADLRTRVAIDVGDLEMRDEEPMGPPLARAARLVAVAHPGQVILSAAAHDALTGTGEPGWAAESLGRFDIVGLDPAVHLYQLVGNGFGDEFPDLCTDRLPPPVPDGVARSVPGYELRALIGEGELGEVHRAYQPTVGREVAVRIFGPGMVGHPQFVRRFETASQRITRVEHPRVVPLLDYWREPNRAVMVTRLMAGGDLAGRIPDGGMDPAAALATFEAVASGIASSHRHGVVHGRIRPENVLFDGEGNAFVADLGVDEICAGIVTFATTAYDAPERLGGALATPAADVYSLGVLVHHLLGGSPPPPDRPLPLGDDAVGRVIARATDPDPGRRHQSVTELLSHLGEALAVPLDVSAVFVPARNPYRGLEPFEQADADDFCGRDGVVAEMVAMLEAAQLLLAVGPSGIGKSSVVKAGLVPALTRGAIAGSENWLVTAMTPGDEPFAQLAAALERVANVALPDIVGELTACPAALDDIVARLVPRHTPVLIVVDQLEELFTNTVDEAGRQAFVRMLVALTDQPATAVRLVATMRADYFDRPLGYPGFADAVHGRTIALGAMTTDQLADAIQLPATSVGVQVEPALIERIAADAVSQPGALPLVQHTMAELFEQRDTNIITLDAFEQTGGLAGSVGRRAEAIYQGLDQRCRDTARRVFLRLVNVSDDHDDTRRRVRRTELERSGITADDLDTVLTEYGRHRLLTFDRDPTTRTPTVELAHEALLTEWQRYRRWIDDARDDLLTERRVESAARDWVGAGSDASFLYTGGRLELTESWAATSGIQLSDDERTFLAASRTKVERDRAARTKRRRVISGVLVAALVATTALACAAVVQRRSADAQANVAEARRVAARALVESPHDRALLLAVEAVRMWDSPETRGNVLTTIERSRRATGVINSGGARLLDLVVSPDGARAAVVDNRDTLMLYDLVARQPVARLETEGISYRAPVFSPDGETLAVSAFEIACWFEPCEDFGVELFDADDLRPLNVRFEGATMPSREVVFSPSGDRIAAVPSFAYADPRDNIAVWNVDKPGEPVMRLSLDDPGVERKATLDSDSPGWVAFSADDSRIFAGGAGPTVAFDLETGQPNGLFGGDGALALSPDGRTIAILTSQQTVGLFDTTSGERRTELVGHDALVTAAAFTPDSSRLATVSNDENAAVWDAATGRRQLLLEGHTGSVLGLGFDVAGETLYTAAADGTIMLWDVGGAGGVARRLLDPSLPVGFTKLVLVSPSTSSVVVDRWDEGIRIVDLVGGETVEPPVQRDVAWGAYSPDGQRFIDVAPDGGLRLLDVRNGTVLASTPGRDIDNFGAVAFTADGSSVVVADAGGIMRELDSRTLEPTGRSVDLGIEEPGGIRATTAGVFAVTSLDADMSEGTEVVFGSLDSGHVLERVRVPLPLARANFSVDGTKYALGGFDGRLVIVDVASGEFIGTEDPVHSGGIAWVAFSPDGGTLATLGFDGELLLVDTASAAIRARAQPGPANLIGAMGFAPEGDAVVVAYEDGSVIEFVTDSDRWIEHACGVAGRNLTESEWRDVFGDRPYRETCPTTD
jgi:WD40 repeat protein/DNA-binding SARP family transcriptional activator